MNNNIIVICKKSLYKSTYKKNAFIEGKIYHIKSEDADFYDIFDENKEDKKAVGYMNFSKTQKVPYLFFDDYFEFVNDKN